MQCVAVCCSVLQCVAVKKSIKRLFCWAAVAVSCSVLPCVAVCCSVLQRDPQLRSTSMATSVALHREGRVLQCVAVCCSVLQCVAVCCSVLQRDPQQHLSRYIVRVGCQKILSFAHSYCYYHHTGVLTPYTPAATHYSTQVHCGEDQ